MSVICIYYLNQRGLKFSHDWFSRCYSCSNMYHYVRLGDVHVFWVLYPIVSTPFVSEDIFSESNYLRSASHGVRSGLWFPYMGMWHTFERRSKFVSVKLWDVLGRPVHCQSPFIKLLIVKRWETLGCPNLSSPHIAWKDPVRLKKRMVAPFQGQSPVHEPFFQTACSAWLDLISYKY